MKNKLKNIFTIFLSIGLLSSCVKEEYDAPVVADCVNPGLTKTKEVADLYASAPSDGTTSIYHNIVDDKEVPDYIEAIVVSSDEGGNFYKSMYLEPLDGSKGLNLSIDEVNVYTKKFQPGRKVFLKLNGLAYAVPSSFAQGLIFGAEPTDKFAVDRLSGTVYKDYLIPSCDTYNEDDFVHRITVAQAKSDKYLNTLVEIQDVQFESDFGTYDTDRTDGFDSSVNITDGTNSLVIRTSRFANFAGYNFPSGRGTVRGVLTKYGTGSNPYQIILRTERDVKLTNPRVDNSKPIVGNNIQYLPTFSENFESYTPTTSGTSFPKYVNDAFVGARYWDVKTFSNNKYIQMTSFGASVSKTYLAMPIAFTPGKKLSFKTKDGYNKGNVLKVYYSSNYVPGSDMGQATLVDITSGFTIASGTATGYATNFTNSGNYVIPATLTGNGFFIFEYSGTSTNTTTIQIDDITVN